MKEAARVRRLQEVIAKATAAPTVREVARVIVEQVVAALGGWIGALWLGEPDGTLELVHWVGVEPDRRFRRVPLAGDSPLALAVRTKTPVWIGTRAEYAMAFPQSDQNVDSETEDELACACLPLVAGSGAIGGLMFAFRDSHEFTEDESTFLVTIASECANAIERLRLLERMSQLYTTEAEARRQAEAASRAKDEFLALLGHELRNPLAPIVTALSLMKLRPSREFERERDIIERQVQHMVRLVDDLLDVARIARGNIVLVRKPVVLATAVAQAVEAAMALIQQRSHTITIDVSHDIVVDADPHRLAQVLSNLVVNAAKYTLDRGELTISARRDDGFAHVRVRDSGVGIGADLLPHVFDMFVQGARASDRPEGGLGLGLAVVKRLVERHGGHVEAASDGHGEGSTFSLSWPLARTATLAPSASHVVTTGARPLRVLVVDDNVDAASTLGDLLRALGHDPIVVHDAPSALEIARDERPQLALVDLGLPILDGFELVARLRSLPGLDGLRAIAVTGYGQPSVRARSEAAGFDSHVVKPVGLDDLRALLHSP